LYPEEPDEEGAKEILRYHLAILNSTVVHWQIAYLSHRYSHGYTMLEVKTLSKIRVPDPSRVPVATMKRMQKMVADLISNPAQESLDRELDDLVASLYGLTRSERHEIGLEG
jgi:hypothetical protein